MEAHTSMTQLFVKARVQEEFTRRERKKLIKFVQAASAATSPDQEINNWAQVPGGE